MLDHTFQGRCKYMIDNLIARHLSTYIVHKRNFPFSIFANASEFGISILMTGLTSEIAPMQLSQPPENCCFDNMFDTLEFPTNEQAFALSIQIVIHELLIEFKCFKGKIRLSISCRILLWKAAKIQLIQPHALNFWIKFTTQGYKL